MLGDSIRRRRGPPGRPAPRKGSGGGGPADEPGARPAKKAGRARGTGRWDEARKWALWAAIAVGVLFFGFGAGYLLATRVFFPPPETAGVGVSVPSLYGLDRGDAERSLREVGLAAGDVTEVENARVRAGQVVAQEPLPEQQLRPGAQVSFAVSMGPPEARVPPVAGLGRETALLLLGTAGFDVTVQELHDRDVPPGRVLGTEPGAGATAHLPAAVALVVSLGPEEVVEPVDTVPPDEPVPPVWP